MGLLAQKFYKDYETLNYDSLIDTLDNINSEIIYLLKDIDNKTLYNKPWYNNKWTLGKMVQFNTSSPYKNATNHINKWLKEKNT